MHNGNIPAFVEIILVIIGIFWCVMIYLMLFNQKLWLEWFVNKPYRQWGLQVTIIDEARFKRMLYIYACVPFVFGIIGLIAAMTCTAHH